MVVYEEIKMSYCSICGAQLREGVNFCPACGSKVQQQPVQQPQPPQPVPQQPSQVPSMQQPAQIQPQQQTSAIPPYQQPYQQQQNVAYYPKKSYGKIIGAVITVVIILILLLVVFFVLLGNGNDDDDSSSGSDQRFIGTWKAVQLIEDGSSTYVTWDWTFTFNSDGTAISDNDGIVDQGTWEIKNNQICGETTYLSDNNCADFQFTQNDNTLTLTQSYYDDWDQSTHTYIVVLTKESSNNGNGGNDGTTGDQSSFYGTWDITSLIVDGDETISSYYSYSITYNSDLSYTANVDSELQTGEWYLSGGKLYMIPDYINDPNSDYYQAGMDFSFSNGFNKLTLTFSGYINSTYYSMTIVMAK